MPYATKLGGNTLGGSSFWRPPPLVESDWHGQCSSPLTFIGTISKHTYILYIYREGVSNEQLFDSRYI